MSASASETFYRAALGAAPAHASLSGHVKTEICIVGGGFTGLSAALHLASIGARPVLIEAETIGYGASGRNGGQIHTGLRQTQRALERWLGKLHARDLWNLSEDAKSLLRELAARYDIDCALKGGLVIAADDRGAIGPLADDTEYLQAHYGYSSARMMDAAETARSLGTDVYPAARFDSEGGHLQPLAFAHGIAAAAEAAGARLHEHTRAQRIEASQQSVRVLCDRGTVDAEHVILACDAYSGVLVPELAPYIAHVESFMTATEPLPDEVYQSVLPNDSAVADTRHVLDYFRKSEDRRMLFAGRETYFTVPRHRGDRAAAHAAGISHPEKCPHGVRLERHRRNHAHAHAACGAAQCADRLCARLLRPGRGAGQSLRQGDGGSGNRKRRAVRGVGTRARETVSRRGVAAAAARLRRTDLVQNSRSF